jgi:hypothetical protein
LVFANAGPLATPAGASLLSLLYPMKNLFSSALLAVLWALASPAAHAQAPADGGPTPAAPTETPLDGGASLLLAGGVAYALRRLHRAPPVS